MMNERLMRSEVQDYLSEHADQDAGSIVLGKSPFEGISPHELAEQVEGRQRIRRKLPGWHQAKGIYYPKKLNIEQSSSELSAAYKLNLLPRVKTAADLTGGFGVDAFYLSQAAERFTYCEEDAELVDLVSHNMNVLGASNIAYYTGDGIEHLKSLPADHYGFIFIDPARRKSGKKVFQLSDCTPDVSQLEELFLEKSPITLIKLSPMLDIRQTLRQLKSVASIVIVSTENEVKELLIRLNRTPVGPVESVPIRCALLDPAGARQEFEFNVAQEEVSKPVYGFPEQYLYEADAALLKAGCFKYLATHFGLRKLHQHTHLYTNEQLTATFPGRRFRIIGSSSYAAFKKKHPFKKANISTRNFPVEVREIRKRLSIKEGGEDYLFCCTGPDKSLLVIHAVKAD